MTLKGWSKNTKGAALIYAIMVLLLLATVIVSMTAISSASYADAVLSVSDDQSYYYAKSIGLAIKEQFKDGYNIAKIIDKLDQEEAIYQKKKEKKEAYDPRVTGTFNIADDSGELVNGTVQMRYARDSVTDEVNVNIIEVRTACLVNNSLSIVTSIYSCEDDSEEEIEHLDDAFTDYDVILTNTEDLSFNFAQAKDSTDKSSLSVYVYAGEDDNVENPIFWLYVDMGGKLTTTGKTTIASVTSSADKKYNTITGNLTSYGDLGLYATSVDGQYGVHSTGNVVLASYSFVKNNIYSKGEVAIADPGEALHTYFAATNDVGVGGVYGSSFGKAQAQNVYAQSHVTLSGRAFITGNIQTHGNVTVWGTIANPNAPALADHYGNAYVGGNIYADGNVVISHGATVAKNIYAKGDVYVQYGAFVVGNIQSINGNVYVLGGGVGGQVNCPNGCLWISNAGLDAYGDFLSMCDYGGRITYGGVGLFQTTSGSFKHTCKTFVTGDCDRVVQVRGNLYVSQATQYGITYFNSVWCSEGAVYLSNSTAGFQNGGRAYVGANQYGNAYTFIQELNQVSDLYNAAYGTSNPWVDMAGARIMTLNVGNSASNLRDAYIYDGWIGTVVNARCIFLSDMRFDDWASLYAAQFIHMYHGGTKYTNAGYNRTLGLGSYSYKDGVMYVGPNVSIQVACRKLTAYDGVFLTETRVGFSLGINTEVASTCTVKVGSSSSNMSSFVLLGDDYSKDVYGNTANPAKFYGTMHAYVGSFKITGKTRLSNKSSNTSGTTYAAKIYAEIAGSENAVMANTGVRPTAAASSFYVEKANGTQYRYGSEVQVKGKAYVAGYLYDFKHFQGSDSDPSFTNTTDARIQGTFVSTAKTLNLQGTSTFGSVQATDPDVVVTLTGTLTVSGLLVNGTLNINNKTLTVKGDLYTHTLKTSNLYNTTVEGNFTVDSVSTATPLTASTKIVVQKDFLLKTGSLTLDKSGSSVGGLISLGGGNLTLSCASGTVSVKNVDVSGDLTISAGGSVTGDFKCNNLIVNGGNLTNDKTTIKGIVSGTYQHSSGIVKYADITVKASSVKAVEITGGTGNSVDLYATNGGAVISGGSSLNYYGGNLSAKSNVTITGSYRCGATSRNGSVTVGSTSDTEEYPVGYGVSGDEETNTYRVIYGYTSVVWQGKAYSPYSGTIMYATPTRVASRGAVIIGNSSNYIKGFFQSFTSEKSSVTAYVESVMGVYAETGATVYVDKKNSSSSTSGVIGINNVLTGVWSGIQVKNGDAHVGGRTSAAKLYGQNLISNGNFYFDTAMQTDARIQCKNIYGLDKVSRTDPSNSANKLVTLSLYLTAPARDSDGYYELKYSLVKASSTSNTTGDLSIEGNLKYSSPVRVEGELYVNGYFKYNNSLTDLVSLGGLYCLNTGVRVSSAFKGNIHLPNVTEITLDDDIGGLNAPRVTSFNINHNVSGSLSLSSCKSITVKSGITIGGSLEIAPDGKITNNGNIGADVSCGEYAGSGTVGGNLILQDASKTSSFGGKISGNIWSPGSISITSTQTFGGNKTYIYAAQNISITNATFASNMDYILTTGGNITLTNCKTIPKVWNMKGEIKFSNDSSHPTTVASVLSYGTNINVGGDKDHNYQTFNGAVEWAESAKGSVTFYGQSTTFKGTVRLLGTGNVSLAKCTYEGDVLLKNTGTVTSEGGTIKNLYINKSDDIRVTSATISAKVTGKYSIYGTKSTTMVTLKGGADSNSDSDIIYLKGLKSLTINGGTYSRPIWVEEATTVSVKSALGSKLSVYSADTLTVDKDKTISGDVRLHNVKMAKMDGNIGGYFQHTSGTTPSSWNDLNDIYLGTPTHQITVGGNVSARGRLVDNSKITVSGKMVNCQGAYYADLKKSFANTTSVNFKTEQGGSCIVLGSPDEPWSISETAFNVEGRLIIYTFWNESKNTYPAVTFKKEIKANALIVNRKPPETYSGNTDGLLNSAPTDNSNADMKIIRYKKSDSSHAYGEDKHAWMEKLQSTNNTEKGKTKSDVYYDATWSSNKELVIFQGKVSISSGNGYTGTCYAANTKFGNQLLTAGQVNLIYCQTYSAGFSSDTNHSNYSSNDNGINVSGDGAFLHTTSASGQNYFSHVNTYSNVSVYYGVSHILGGSYFKGTVYSGSDGEVSYKGHRSTKLFYFGDSVELYGGSAIYSNQQSSSCVAAGRTIVWVNKGALVVRDDSYIGSGKVKRETTYERKDYAQHPGVFVSDTGSGTVKIGSTNYNRGSVNVIGKGSNAATSTITLDVCAYREINIKDYGVIVGKYGSEDWESYCGMYVTKGSINQTNNGWISVLKNRGDRYGSRHYWAANSSDGISDSTAYIPNGDQYLKCFNTKWESYKKYAWGSHYDTKTKTYSQTKAQLTQCYTPKSSAPSIDAPQTLNKASGGYRPNNGPTQSGVGSSSWGISSAAKTAPTKPTITTVGTIYNPASGNATVSAIQVVNEVDPDKPVVMSEQSVSFTVATVAPASSEYSFGGLGAVTSPAIWTYPVYTVSVTMQHPSKQWTADITRHFDTDENPEKAYWNTRFIPYTWKLPYEDSSGTSTPAKRILQTGDSVEYNGHVMLKQENKTYYVNEDHYSGSTLAGIAGSIYGWRSSKINNGKLWDYIVLNGYPEWDGPFDKDPDHKRRTKLLIFESGELPYSAFFMGDGTGSEDHASWHEASSNKTIIGKKQKAWFFGDSSVSFYDSSIVFYACANPANPYGSTAKDLHVVLPQGIGLEVIRDAENTMTVVGKGRVFLYLTSGDTLIVRGKATNDVFPNPIGGLKKVGSYYEPQLYIIGAGTNISLTFDCMPLGCFIYMPFGNKDELYGSSGSLKSYNVFRNATGGAYSSKLYTSSTTATTTSVARNYLMLDWSSYSSGGNRNVSGTIVADNFYYYGGSNGNKLNFSNSSVRPNLSETTIYSYSTTSSYLNGGKKYSLSQFLTAGPGFSTKMLKWDYKGVRVSA
ncbi:MAG TPA: hypothetical protein DIC18_02340 [Clostridiales bacterium]|nr:hypothetical protein [Clostridiales bacterium]